MRDLNSLAAGLRPQGSSLARVAPSRAERPAESPRRRRHGAAVRSRQDRRSASPSQAARAGDRAAVRRSDADGEPLSLPRARSFPVARALPGMQARASFPPGEAKARGTHKAPSPYAPQAKRLGARCPARVPVPIGRPGDTGRRQSRPAADAHAGGRAGQTRPSLLRAAAVAAPVSPLRAAETPGAIPERFLRETRANVPLSARRCRNARPRAAAGAGDAAASRFGSRPGGRCRSRLRQSTAEAAEPPDRCRCFCRMAMLTRRTSSSVVRSAIELARLYAPQPPAGAPVAPDVETGAARRGQDRAAPMPRRRSGKRVTAAPGALDTHPLEPRPAAGSARRGDGSRRRQEQAAPDPMAGER